MADLAPLCLQMADREYLVRTLYLHLDLLVRRRPPSVAPSYTQLSSPVLRVLTCGSEWGGAELDHEKTLLFALALIAVGCTDARQSALCEGLSEGSPLEDVIPCAEQGNAFAQYFLGFIYDSGRGVASVHKLISLAQHSTRKHYPGAHRVEVMLNGAVHPGDEFEIV